MRSSWDCHSRHKGLATRGCAGYTVVYVLVHILSAGYVKHVAVGRHGDAVVELFFILSVSIFFFFSPFAPLGFILSVYLSIVNEQLLLLDAHATVGGLGQLDV